MNQIISLNQTFEAGFPASKKDLLKNLFFKNSSDDEFEIFLHACERTHLDPFMRQICPVKRMNRNIGREEMTIQVQIDGYRLIAERTGKYTPGRQPTYQYDETGNLISATAYVKKLTCDGVWHEVSATAFFKEYAPYYKDQKTGKLKLGHFWEKMPHGQLAKCAEALALRKAFPGDLSGIYINEEMQQAESYECQAQIIQHKATEKTRVIEQIQSFISKEQVKALNELLQYDEEYLREIYKYFNISHLSQIQTKDFDRTHKSCLKRSSNKNIHKTCEDK